MAHDAQREFLDSCRTRFPELFKGVSVLEVGSLDINGTVRDFFDAERYVGVDIGPGPGVDVVCAGQDLDYPDRSFDVAISAECFEHNPFWLATFTNMCRIADRAVLFTCATLGRREHGTARTSPADSPHTVAAGWSYYRNLTERDFTDSVDLNALFDSWEFAVNEQICDLYFLGFRREATCP